jgi:hypothetical protein
MACRNPASLVLSQKIIFCFAESNLAQQEDELFSSIYSNNTDD